MSGFSNYYKHYILSIITSQNVYVALTLINPTYYDDGASLVEPLPSDYDTYMRVPISPSDWETIIQEDNIISVSNASAIVFPKCTITVNTLIFGYALVDQAVNGNVIVYGEFSPLPVGSDITPILPPSSITLSLT